MEQHTASLTQRSLPRRSWLVAYLAIAYTLLVCYASLYPFVPWRSLASPSAFLFEAWPRYYTASDVALNVMGYIPLGLLAALALRGWVSPRWAAVLSIAVGTMVSFGMESMQTFVLPRVPSKLDLLSNSLGTLAGAVLAVAGGERWLLTGRLHRLRNRMFLPGAVVDAGFVVLVLWLFTQLYPAVWLFGNGDLHFVIQDPRNLAYTPTSYRWIETGVTALNLAGICALMSSIARRGQNIAGPLLLLVVIALLLKSVAAATFFRSGDASLWVTPGAMLGIPAGIVIYLALVKLHWRVLPVAAASLFLAGALLVNVAPENPYLLASMQTWSRGHFLSFNGTTRLVSALWPFLAAAYLLRWAWQQSVFVPSLTRRPQR